MSAVIQKMKMECEDILTRCKEELSAMRASRANPAMVENILVDSYGTKSPIEHVATISTPDPRTLVIQPWDKSIMKAIEEGIRSSELGLNPVNEGDLIRLIIPALTEERRKELVRSLNQKIEGFRVRLRQLREEIKESITQSEKNKEFGEDEKFRMLEELDKVVASYNEKLKELADAKERDIMTV